MKRAQAIDLLVERELITLSPQCRSDILLEWWRDDEGEEGFERLPAGVKDRIRTLDSADNPSSPIYDPLVRLALRHRYFGVKNSWLQSRLGNNVEHIEGDAELLEPCPCCGYRSLSMRGEYDICRVCFWEDDGSSQAHQFSNCNGMTLGEARLNFAKLGAIDKRALRNILTDGKERYESS